MVGQLEAADLPRERAGVRALLAAEQLALDQRRGIAAQFTRTMGRPRRGSARGSASRTAPCRCRSRRADKLATFIALFVSSSCRWCSSSCSGWCTSCRRRSRTSATIRSSRPIRTLCLLSLVFGGLLWPIAWLWAYLEAGHVQDGLRHRQASRCSTNTTRPRRTSRAGPAPRACAIGWRASRSGCPPPN